MQCLFLNGFAIALLYWLACVASLNACFDCICGLDALWMRVSAVLLCFPFGWLLYCAGRLVLLAGLIHGVLGTVLAWFCACSTLLKCLRCVPECLHKLFDWTGCLLCLSAGLGS